MKMFQKLDFFFAWFFMTLGVVAYAAFFRSGSEEEAWKLAFHSAWDIGTAFILLWVLSGKKINGN